jgi:stage II sporulation protein D
VKEYIVIIVVFVVFLFGTPVVFGAVYENPASQVIIPVVEQEITLFLTETDEVIRLSVQDYLIGCLFAQIPASYHEQALNAQAVAAHTYLLRLMLDRGENPVITDNATTCQPFFTEDRAIEHYGEDYGQYLDKVRAAAGFGASRVIVYDNEPIYAVYHSISAGATNTAYSVWGRDFPYLRSVDSSWDTEHPGFTAINEMTSESIRLAIFDYNRTASMPVDYDLWFVNPIKNDFGYVISVKAGETLLSGGDMWRIFNLRSTSFDITFRSGGIFVIQTRGFGHGAGLSQYGADVLANRGFDASQILQHYFTDVTILQV